MANSDLKRKTSACSFAIRKELKRTFPKIKFRVKSTYYHSGSMIDVFWENGPVDHVVTVLLEKYILGGVCDKKNIREGVPQINYVLTHRSKSKNILSLLPSFEEECPTPLPDSEIVFHRLFGKSPFPFDADNFKIIRTATTVGNMEDFFEFIYTSSTATKSSVTK